jgi:hypothetical protein
MLHCVDQLFSFVRLRAVLNESHAASPLGWPEDTVRVLEILIRITSLYRGRPKPGDFPDLERLVREYITPEIVAPRDPGDARNPSCLSTATGVRPDAVSALPTDPASHRPPVEPAAPRAEGESKPPKAPAMPASPKRRRLKRGDAPALIRAALESLAARGEWNKSDSEIIKRAGVCRSTYYHALKADEGVKRSMEEYQSRRLGQGPARRDDF